MVDTELSQDVIIIGAGLAGISAACCLMRLGISNFIVLEAHDCIGGRLRSINIDECAYPLGPLWLHGKNSNPLYQLAKSYGLPIRKSETEDFVMRTETGDNVTEQGKEILEKLNDITEKVLKDLHIQQDSGQVFRERCCNDVWKEYGWNPKDTLEMAIDCFWFDLEYGITSDIMSLFGWFKLQKIYEGDDGIFDDYIIGHQNGFLELLTAMKKDAFGDQDEKYLKLNCVVNQITVQSSKNVEIRTTAGAIYKAKQCIVTLPNSTFKSGLVKFSPSLPEQKLNALNKLSCVNLYKVYVIFSKDITPFWDNAPTILYASSQKGYFSKWVNLSAFKITEENPNILMSEVIGDGVEAIKTLSKQELFNEVVSVLSRMYPNSFVAPTAVELAEVSSDPFHRGAFPGIYAPMDDEILTWAEKSIGPILFAGDGATINYLGCSQGAYLTGEWRAKDAVKELRKDT